jgi:hypothetical protein
MIKTLVRFETPGGSPVFVSPYEVHSLSAETETSSVIETGHFLYEVSGTVDEVAVRLGQEEEP